MSTPSADVLSTSLTTEPESAAARPTPNPMNPQPPLDIPNTPLHSPIDSPQSAINSLPTADCPQPTHSPFPHGPSLWPLRPDTAAAPTPQNPTESNTKSNDSPDTTSPRLSPRQQTAISLLLAGHSYSAVAAVLNINRCTLYEWKRKPDFRRELLRRQNEVRRASDARLRLLMLQTTQTALESLRAPGTMDRYRHAFRLLTLLRPYLPMLDQPEPPDPDDPLESAS